MIHFPNRSCFCGQVRVNQVKSHQFCDVKIWKCEIVAKKKGGPGWLILVGMGECLFPLRSFFQQQTSWRSPQRSYLNHKCLSFSQSFTGFLVSWGILGPIKALVTMTFTPGPPQGSAPLLTSPLLASPSSSGPAPEFWLVQQCTQKTLGGQCLFSLGLLFSSLLPLVLAQVGTYQRQSSSVMWPNHLDTHLACSSEDSYEYSRWCQGQWEEERKRWE